MPRTKTYHLHLPHFHLDNSKNLRLLYALRVLRAVVNKLAWFFVPLFVFQLREQIEFLDHFPLTSFQKGMVLLAIFYGTTRVISLFVAMPVGKLVTKIGYPKSFVTAHLLYGAALVALNFTAQNPMLIFLVPIFDGLQTNFMWPSLYTVLSKNAMKIRMGQNLGILQFFLNMAWMISPALGGIIIVLMGYQPLFLIGLVIILLAVGVALSMDDIKVRDRVSFKEFFAWLAEAKFLRLAVTYAGRYINDAALTLWPLYVFLLIGTVDRVGYLYSFSFFLSMVLSLFIGFRLDHNKNKKPFFLSGGILSLLWFVRIQVVSFWSIVVIDMFDKITSNFHWLFYDRVLFNRGKGGQAFSYFLYREMIISVSAIVFWLIFAAIFIFLPMGWQGLFILASIGVLLSLLIREKHN